MLRRDASRQRERREHLDARWVWLGLGPLRNENPCELVVDHLTLRPDSEV